MVKAGRVSLISLSDRERERFFLYMMGVRSSSFFDFLEVFEGGKIFPFLDLFAGETVRIPSRTETLKTVLYVRVYSFIQDRLDRGDGKEKALIKAARVFERRKVVLWRMYEKVNRQIQKGEKDGSVNSEEGRANQ
jgi:hypothetical protein